MSQTAKKNRIIFLDLLRAFAVLNMVQGHTVDVLLGTQFRSEDSILFGIWLFNRGMTAPLFLFTAGTTFTYLFRIQSTGFSDNPRFYKGFKRALLLLVIGYLLKLPTNNPFILDGISPEKWTLFFAADVLQIIAIGLLSLMVLLYIGQRFSFPDLWVLGIASFITILAAPFILKFAWSDLFHVSVANYLSRSHGSLFTIFPWLAYIFCGGILGSYLAHAGRIKDEKKLGTNLFYAGTALVLFSVINYLIELAVVGSTTFWSTSPALVFLRLGLVLIVTWVFIMLSVQVKNIPKVVVLLGRNTLIIYVVHLVILYGSPWSLGIYNFYALKLTPIETLFSALVMIMLMIGMVWIFKWLNFKNRQLVTS